MLLPRLVVVATLVSLVSACGGGGSSSNGSSTSDSGAAPDPVAAPTSSTPSRFPAFITPPSNNSSMLSCRSEVPIDAASTVQGRVLYQRVPILSSAGFNGGLDYDAITGLPVRGAVVQAVAANVGGGCSDTVLATTLSNGQGDYGFNLALDTAVCIEVRAQLFRDGSNSGAGWDIQVTDNTQDSSPYYLVGSSQATPRDNPVRNLIARAGVEPGEATYTSERAAAPFAILDTLCEGIDLMVTTDAGIELPLLFINWSQNNVEAAGDVTVGDVGSAFFRQSRIIDSSNNVISATNDLFFLGDQDNNTDEYDTHVIMHEFGHYISANFSRYDAYGGSHSIGDRLDFRLAFEEGWADAFSGIALDNAGFVSEPRRYRDSFGSNQGINFAFSLDRNHALSSGWYSESSVFAILYNLFDSDNGETYDSLSLGFAPLFEVLTSDSYKNSDAFSSIFSFINNLKNIGGNNTAIDELLESEDLESVVDDFASTETGSNNDVAFLFFKDFIDIDPVYHSITTGSSVEVCSNGQHGAFNKLSVFQYLVFDAGISSNYNVSVEPSTIEPVNNGRALVEIYQRGNLLSNRTASQAGQVVNQSIRLSGVNIIAVADALNYEVDSSDLGRRCFTVSVN